MYERLADKTIKKPHEASFIFSAIRTQPSVSSTLFFIRVPYTLQIKMTFRHRNATLSLYLPFIIILSSAFIFARKLFTQHFSQNCLHVPAGNGVISPRHQEISVLINVV